MAIKLTQPAIAQPLIPTMERHPRSFDENDPRRVAHSGRQNSLQTQRAVSTNYFIGPHHVVVFMFQHVTVIYVSSGVTIETHDYREHFTGVDYRRVLPASFIRRWFPWLSYEFDFVFAQSCGIVTLSFEDLKLHQGKCIG